MLSRIRAVFDLLPVVSNWCVAILQHYGQYDHVVSRKRNRLTTARAEKSVYAFQNLRAVEKFDGTNSTALYEQMYRGVFGSDVEASSDSEGP